MTREGEQGVVYESEARRKVLTDGGERPRKEKKGRRGKGAETRRSPGVWVDTLWKLPAGESSEPLPWLIRKSPLA